MEFNKNAEKKSDFSENGKRLEFLAQLDQVFSDNANFPDVFTHGHNFMCLGQVPSTTLKHRSANNNKDTYLKIIIDEKYLSLRQATKAKE